MDMEVFMKKRGFTLIEIMSVIVIIGIIAFITVPIIMKVVGEARKRSFLITAEGIVRATSFAYAEKADVYKNYFASHESIVFKFSKSEDKKGESIEPINGEIEKLSFDGKSPIGGEIKLHKNGGIEVVNLTDGEYFVNKDVDTELVISEESTTLTREELQVAVEELQKQMEDLKTAKLAQDTIIQKLSTKLDNAGQQTEVVNGGSKTLSHATVFNLATITFPSEGEYLVNVQMDVDKLSSSFDTGKRVGISSNIADFDGPNENFYGLRFFAAYPVSVTNSNLTKYVIVKQSTGSKLNATYSISYMRVGY